MNNNSNNFQKNYPSQMGLNNQFKNINLSNNNTNNNTRTHSPLQYINPNNNNIKTQYNLTPKQYSAQQTTYQSRDISPQYSMQQQQSQQQQNLKSTPNIQKNNFLQQPNSNQTNSNVNIRGTQNQYNFKSQQASKQTSKSPVQRQNYMYQQQQTQQQQNNQQKPNNYQQYQQQQQQQNPSQRINTYAPHNEAEQIYMGMSQSKQQGNRVCATAPNMLNTLDSFSQITGSILDEGVNSNMPTSKQITGSKQPLYIGGKMQPFFSNYNNNLDQSQQQYNLQYLQQQQQQSSQNNPYLIKNKDTGEVYDIREYNKIRDEEQAHNFLQNNKNNQPQQQQQQQQQYDTQHNIYRHGQLSQRAHSPYLANKQNQQNNNGNNGNNAKSLSPMGHTQNTSYNQFSNQTSQNTSQRQSNISNISGKTSNISSQQNQGQQQGNINPSWQQLLNPVTKVNNELILMAKINNQEKCVELLDKRRGNKKADVNARGEDNWTPLHYAALNGNAKLLSFLLYHDAIIDSLTKQQVTPLIIASQRGYDDIFQILMTAGADINFVDVNGDSPLHHASRNGNKTIVEMLLRKPSLNYSCKNKKNQEAVDIALNSDIKKVFDDFVKFKKAIMNNHPKLQIYNAQQDKVTQMFNTRPVETAQNKFNTDLTQKYNQNVKANINGKYTKNSSINSEHTTDENSGGSFNNEEKVGPQHFLVHGLIGKGSFGEVYLVEKKSNNMLYAMKVLHKSKVMRNNLTRYALTERNVLSLTNHPFIVKMQFAFQTPDKLFLILDYCPGGDLGELLQKEKKFTEERVRLYLCEIILALQDLHKRDVIFRDLKPDNIVLDHEGHAKLTDFGLSKEGILNPNTGARSFCGSVAYLAPEMLNRCGHGKAVDWYLLGVVMYEFLVGIPPYYANNRDELFYNIKKAPLKLPSSLSAEAKSLLKALLQRNPAKRLGSGKGDAEEIKQHKYFQGINWNEVLNKKLKPPIPKRKIRISTKFDPNIFESTGTVEEDKQKIAGWSFVAPQHYQ